MIADLLLLAFRYLNDRAVVYCSGGAITVQDNNGDSQCKVEDGCLQLADFVVVVRGVACLLPSYAWYD